MRENNWQVKSVCEDYLKPGSPQQYFNEVINAMDYGIDIDSVWRIKLSNLGLTSC